MRILCVFKLELTHIVLLRFSAGSSLVGGVIAGAIPYTRSELGFLQLLYSNVDDPDSMSGITTLRARLLLGESCEPTHDSEVHSRGSTDRMRSLRERIRDLEHEGRWEDALLCYEQAIQTMEDVDCDVHDTTDSSHSENDPESANVVQHVAIIEAPDVEIDDPARQLHSGLLRCLCNVGHLETALNRAIGVTRRKPGLTSTVLPHATEAAWRLGKWDSLDSLLQRGSKVYAPSKEASGGPRSYRFSIASSLSHLHTLTSNRSSHSTASLLPGVDQTHETTESFLSVAKDVRTVVAALAEGSLYASLDISNSKKGTVEAAGALANAAALWSAITPVPLLSDVSYAALGNAQESAVACVSDIRSQFSADIAAARTDIMSSLAAASMESYSRAYPWLVRLHSLRELERAVDLVQTSGAASRDNIVASWDLDARLTLASPSANIREEILAPRHAIFRIFNLKDREASVWVDMARLARSSGNHVAASAALLRANALGSDVAAIHSAKLLYLQGHVHRALQAIEPVEQDLDTIVARLQAACAAAVGQGEERVRATQRACVLEAKRTLYATRWMVESRLVPEPAAIARFGDVLVMCACLIRYPLPSNDRFGVVCKLYPEWEKAWFCLGKFYDTQLKAASKAYSDVRADEATTARRDTHILGVIEAYCKALVYGHGHIFEALPRVLTLMFDYGAACAVLTNMVAAAAAKDTAAHGAASTSLSNLIERTGMAGPQEKTLEQIIRRVKDMRSKSA